MLTASDLKRGVRIELDGDPYHVMETHIQSPTARGASTLVKAKIRNMRTANVFALAGAALACGATASSSCQPPNVVCSHSRVYMCSRFGGPPVP